MSRAKYISQTEYARHRGVSQPAVARAIRDGRLTKKSVIMGRNGKRRVAKIRSLELADAEWLANTDTRRVTQPTSAPQGDDKESRVHRRKMNALALEREEIKRDIEKEKLRVMRAEADEKSGALIPVQEARDDVIRIFGDVRTALLALPSKAKQLIPRLELDDIEKLDRLVRESLEELADEDW